MSAASLLSNRLFLAFEDMQDAKRYLAAVEELSVSDQLSGTSAHYYHREAIFVAVVVTYCRPFKKSQTLGNADRFLDPKALGLFATRPDLEALHNELITHRDKVAAHADWEYHNTELLSRDASGAIHRKSPRPSFMLGIAVPRICELVDYVLQECRQRTYCLDSQSLNEDAI